VCVLLLKQFFVQLSTSADSVALLAFGCCIVAAADRLPCSKWLISPGCWAHSSKPAAAECDGQTGQMDIH